MSYKFFKLSKEESIGIVVLNNPPVNAFTLEMAKELDTLLNHVSKMESIKSLLITGNNNVFSAGADINLMESKGWNYLEELIEVGQRAFKKIESLPKTVIAVINGHCMGAGLELALACDLRFMTTGKAKLGLPEVKIGIMPAWGGVYRLPRLIGKSKAFDLMVRGGLLNPEEAKEIGIVDEVYANEELMDKSMEYAKNISEGATFAIGMIKKGLNESYDLSLEGNMKNEIDLLNMVFDTQDRVEGMRAFLEKRKPKFSGR